MNGYEDKVAGLASIGSGIRPGTGVAEAREVSAIGPLLGQANAVCAQLEDAVQTVIGAWNAFKRPTDKDATDAGGVPGYPTPSDRLEAIAERLAGISNQAGVLHALAQDIRSRT